jgi:hypothetical protein
MKRLIVRNLQKRIVINQMKKVEAIVVKEKS